MDQKAGGPGALAQERGLQKVDVGSALRAVRLSWKGFGLRSPRALTWLGETAVSLQALVLEYS